MLNLPERMFIISIDDDQGAISSKAHAGLRFGLASALLAELNLMHKVRIEDNRLIVLDATPLGDPLADTFLEHLAAAKKPRKLDCWIESFRGNHMLRQVAKHLAVQGVLRIEEKHYLWVIPYELYPQSDASAKYWVKEHLRNIVLTGEIADESDIILISLIKGCQLLNLLFTRDERKAAKKKIKKIISGEVFGEAVESAIAEVTAANAMI